MAVRILRRPKAAEDVEEIASYIARENLQAALRFLEATEATVKALASFPHVGSRFNSARSELADLRCRRVQGFPNHVLFYVLHEDAIEIVRVLHGARDLDAELGDS